MDTNPASKPNMQMHELKLTSDQLMLAWQLTELASPSNGSAADLLTSLRNRLRPAVAKIRKSIEDSSDNENGKRIPEMVRGGRSA